MLMCFLKKRNKVVLSFLDGLSEDYVSNLTKCVALGQIYSMNSPYLVAPFSFTRNVLQYQASQSRVCTDLNGKLGPCDSYKTIANWLTSQSTSPVAFPVFDSQVAFDNDQVVGRSWQVRTNNKGNAIIVTSACVTPLQQQSFHQFNTALHPRNWFNCEVSSGNTSVHEHISQNDEQKCAFKDGKFNDEVEKGIS